MKTCSKCHETKELSEFYFDKTNGRLRNPCKACTIASGKERYKERGEEDANFLKLIRARSLKRYREDACIRQLHIDRARKWHANNREKVLASKLAYQKRNREKTTAKSAVEYALETGVLEKPVFCERCGIDGKLNGHHDDYSKQLDVVWLCHTCHMQVHVEKRALLG